MCYNTVCIGKLENYPLGGVWRGQVPAFAPTENPAEKGCTSVRNRFPDSAGKCISSTGLCGHRQVWPCMVARFIQDGDRGMLSCAIWKQRQRLKIFAKKMSSIRRAAFWAQNSSPLLIRRGLLFCAQKAALRIEDIFFAKIFKRCRCFQIAQDSIPLSPSWMNLATIQGHTWRWPHNPVLEIHFPAESGKRFLTLVHPFSAGFSVGAKAGTCPRHTPPNG